MFTNAYGKQEKLEHQQNYGPFAKAIQAVTQEAESGALKEKVVCKRRSALHHSGSRSRVQGASPPCLAFAAELVDWVVPPGIALSAPHVVDLLKEWLIFLYFIVCWATCVEPDTLASLRSSYGICDKHNLHRSSW